MGNIFHIARVRVDFSAVHERHHRHEHSADQHTLERHEVVGVSTAHTHLILAQTSDAVHPIDKLGIARIVILKVGIVSHESCDR